MTETRSKRLALWKWIKARAHSDADAREAAKLVSAILTDALREKGAEAIAKAVSASTPTR